jgi:pyruvate kinase
MRAKTQRLPDDNLAAILEPADPADANYSGTKVVVTVGPACQSVEALCALLEAGASAARIDLTWGPIEYHRRSLDNLQEAMRRTRRLCAVVLDTLGREIMVRRPFRIDPDGWPNQIGQEIPVKCGDKLTLTTRDVEAAGTLLPVTYPGLAAMMEAGDSIYVGRYLVSGADQASLYLKVESVVDGTDVVCVAQNDATLDGLLTIFHVERSADGLSNAQNDLPLLSEYDRQCLAALARDYEVDFISLSYTRSAEDVAEARAFLDSIGLAQTKIFAKLESRQSLLNFIGILSAADGVVVSRGNLGLDCVPEKMALIQKTLVQSCNLVGKPVLITRVVDTMAVTPRPTRAEATDVANAVLDGCDGILLGQETLRGCYPVETVKTVVSIARQAEKVFDHHYHFDHLLDSAFEAVDGEGEMGGVMGGGRGGPAAAAAAAGADGLSPASSSGDIAAGGARRRGPRANDSYSSLSLAIKAMTRFGPTSYASLAHHGGGHGGGLSHLAPGAAAAGAGQGVGVAGAPVTAGATGDSEDGPSSSFLGGAGANAGQVPRTSSAQALYHGAPYLSKLESIASSAVRAADKIGASLIVVYTHSGRTAELVAKYRPPMPILTLVVPRLVSDSLHWRLEGRHNARQCLLTRGLLPVLATPQRTGDGVLEEAIAAASRMGLVQPHAHVVAVQRIHNDFCVKVVAVDALGGGIEKGGVGGTAHGGLGGSLGALAGAAAGAPRSVPFGGQRSITPGTRGQSAGGIVPNTMSDLDVDAAERAVSELRGTMASASVLDRDAAARATGAAQR